MKYEQFLETKKKEFIESGFEVKELNKYLKPFQEYQVRVALKKGRFALFDDCGLGKTLMQLSWSEAIYNKFNKKVLVLTTLGVVEQTKQEAIKFDIDLNSFDIYNYEQIDNIDISKYIGVVLDESSILKGRDRSTSTKLINIFKDYQYKLACSATPSPNDHLELGQHVEFLGYDSYENMKAMFFVQDQKIKSSDKWRLKKHAEDDFWKYICKWSICVDNPNTIGFNEDGYNLPDIEYVEHIIKVENNTNTLFTDVAVSATDLHKDLKRTFEQRINLTKELINKSNGQVLVWSLSNNETDTLEKEIENSINIQGKDSPEKKANGFKKFANNEVKVLITKAKIAGMGLNFQNCNEMIFTSYDFKFEEFYQAVRRCYRFGQKNKVTVHLLVPESQTNVKQSIEKKQQKHFEKIKQMAKYSSETDYKENIDLTEVKETEVKTDNYWLMNGDCNDMIKKIEDNSIDYSFFSPPFKDLYTYSDDPRDMSNVKNDDEFYKHFNFLVPELFRVLKSGRLLSMHIMQGTTSVGKDGFLSIVDFRGELIRLFQEHGFIFHAEVMIRKNPQLAAVRTKNVQLMHGQTKRDSSINRPGLADYILTFRKPGENLVKIQNDIPFETWCKLAEPVWFDIEEGDVISNFRKARGGNDEKHMTPTQLSVIKNCYLLWSNEGDVCFSPFGGVGSEGCQALKMNRKSINIELKKSYFNLNVENHKAFDLEKNSVLTLF